ncbi:hypothetical protein HMPREF9714_00539 [Myroides odoratimimus CCUG 12901]|uniref:Uncharacterized protein n=2 Tax=Myroides odoratimimus TaxID=76832 RepID=A0ABN0ECU7_9FLAO|nr:hypothetical protein MYRA21_1609 [Myroides sp. A21]EHO11083.1 hypothetical protein HMPREF9712_00740 [Myroides odoratimimus CCUG 10230]EHO14277.1 hypothetical protein HMPREF9714_00539 [Myroides odoratimimus CCUG 12901]EHO14661.1 hypothetical protein HMPREF9715_00546 [Myroides odoratimimus CIP 101113]EPH09952.1 hypothetical protein HMPREF9713_02613 [Myroides odoratimimus CCUG 12700]SHM01862.1 hypothetical protein SAMN05444275_108152 [Myroides odoratimimus subsp. xuanwuensis]STZ47152.1 Unchar
MSISLITIYTLNYNNKKTPIKNEILMGVFLYIKGLTKQILTLAHTDYLDNK